MVCLAGWAVAGAPSAKGNATASIRRGMVMTSS
jgi:hypothetical protein